MSQLRNQSLPDDELIRTALDSDSPEAARRAASALLGRYAARVLRWCTRYSRDRDDAMDLAQQSLMRAHQKLGSFEGRAAFSSWLFMVTRSTCLNAMERIDVLRDPEVSFEDLVDPAATPDLELERIEEQQWRREFMNDVLSPVEQRAMILRYEEMLSCEELDRILCLDSKSGARGLLQRARRKLRAALATHEWSGTDDA